LGAQVFGCDISPLAIQSARDCHEGNDSLTLEVGDFLDPSFLAAESFDLVFDRAMLCALDGEDQRNYIRQVWRILKPGACFMSIPFTQVFVPQGPPFALDLRPWLLEQAERFGLVALAEGYPGSIPAAIGEEAIFILQKLGAAK
jgi:SAM-dependent methyltransferase